MENGEAMKAKVRGLYKARVNGDLAGVMGACAEHMVFHINGIGEPMRGKQDMLPSVQKLLDDFRFEDFREVSFVVEGDRGAAHWRTKVVCTATNRSDQIDIVDLFSFENGEIAEFFQSTDTAKILALTTP